jgi:hypothetical protein
MLGPTRLKVMCCGSESHYLDSAFGPDQTLLFSNLQSSAAAENFSSLFQGRSNSYQDMSGSRLAWFLALGLWVILFTCPHCQGLISSSIESPDPELPLRHGSNEVGVVENQKRDDYSCGPGKPCSNGACCGSSGFCGYGPVYCGKGCVSNCDATAECGKYAKTPGKTCPLNTW